MEIPGWTFEWRKIIEEKACNERDVLKLVHFEGLICSHAKGKRNVLLVYVERDREACGLRWFPVSKMDEASDSFKKRMALPDPVKVEGQYALSDIPLSGTEVYVAQFGKQGHRYKVTKNQGFFFVDCDAKRTQNLASAEDVIRYLAIACEDGSSYSIDK